MIFTGNKDMINLIHFFKSTACSLAAAPLGIGRSAAAGCATKYSRHTKGAVGECRLGGFAIRIMC